MFVIFEDGGICFDERFDSYEDAEAFLSAYFLGADSDGAYVDLDDVLSKYSIYEEPEGQCPYCGKFMTADEFDDSDFHSEGRCSN